MDEDAVEVERSVEGQPVPVIRGTSLDRAYLQGATGNLGRSQLGCCSTHECRAGSNVGLTMYFWFHGGCQTHTRCAVQSGGNEVWEFLESWGFQSG